MDRSIKDQEEEMAELKAKIAKQKAVLEGLRDMGLALKRERAEREGNAMET